MIYAYRCKNDHRWEVIKPVAAIDDPEYCDSCKEKGERYITRTYFYGAKVEDAQWCPAMGCVVRDSKHRRQLAKTRKLIEVGSEPVESIHKHMDATLKKKLDDRWKRED